MNKYHNEPTVYDGIRFASKREAGRWQELKLLERAGEISELKRQQSFRLIPALRKPSGGLQRSTNYVADFVYRDNRSKQLVVEDAKGVQTKEYLLKKKLMLFIHGIEIQEV